MESFGKRPAIIALFIIFSFSLNIRAQEVKQLKVSKTEADMKYEEKIQALKLEKKQSLQALSWNKARNFVLNEDGNFVPYYPEESGKSNANLQRLSATGGNCAKIKCPEVFDPDIVCWECH